MTSEDLTSTDGHEYRGDDNGESGRGRAHTCDNTIGAHDHREVTNQAFSDNEDEGLISITDPAGDYNHDLALPADGEEEVVIESELLSNQYWILAIGDFVILQVRYISTLLIFCLIAPSLIMATWITYDLTGRLWPITPFALHFLVSLILARYGCILNHGDTKNMHRTFFVHSRRLSPSPPWSENDQEQQHAQEQNVVQDTLDQESSQEDNAVANGNELSHPMRNNDTAAMSQSKTPLLSVLLGRQSTIVMSSYMFLSLLIDYYLFGKIYRDLLNTLIDTMYTDIDGTTILEWTVRKNIAVILRCFMATIISLRIVLVCIWVVVVVGYSLQWGHVDEESRRSSETISIANANSDEQQHTPLLSSNDETRRRPDFEILKSIKQEQEMQLTQFFKPVHIMTIIISTVWLGVCCTSCLTHLTDWIIPPTPTQIHCDPLDHVECSLPFPSFHHMAPDNTTATGWKVRLRSQSLPVLRSGHIMDSWDFINDCLDGFSTMAPILFAALDGMFDAFMHHSQGSDDKRRICFSRNGFDRAVANVCPQLVANVDNIQDSLTNRSITLLINVDTQELVPHTAEIDFRTVLSERKNETTSSEELSAPLILLIPSQPLNHSTHYAVVVAGATSVDGTILPPTLGMRALLQALKSETVVDPSSYTTYDVHRLRRYREIVIPAMTRAAPWTSSEMGNIAVGASSDYSANGSDLQLLFDFVTVSETAQLTPIRAVRDATIRQVSSGEHRRRLKKVRVVKLKDYKCPFQQQHSDDQTLRWTSAVSEGHAAIDPTPDGLLVARTVHAELDVPWFLNQHGSGHRDATLLPIAEIQNVSQKRDLGIAKFVIHVPCSLKAAALLKNGRDEHGRKSAWRHHDVRPLRGIVEIGHGMFYNRRESHEYPFMR